MSSARIVRNATAALLAGAALVLTGCSSSVGGASVTQTQIENKLKQESELASVKTQVGTTKFNSVVSCIAKTLKKDANGGDLDNYVHGKMKIDAVKGNKDSAKLDVTSCVKSALGTG